MIKFTGTYFMDEPFVVDPYVIVSYYYISNNERASAVVVGL